MSYLPSPSTEKGSLSPRVVVAIALVAVIGLGLAASIGFDDGEDATVISRVNWTGSTPIADTRWTELPGASGQEMGIRDTAYLLTEPRRAHTALFGIVAVLWLDAGAPVGGGRVRCSVKPSRGAEIAKTDDLPVAYPQPGQLNDQPLPSVAQVHLAPSGLGLVALDPLLGNGFGTQEEIAVKWPPSDPHEMQFEWLLPPGSTVGELELRFATLWTTTGARATKIACSSTTDKGTASLSVGGPPPPRDRRGPGAT